MQTQAQLSFYGAWRNMVVLGNFSVRQTTKESKFYNRTLFAMYHATRSTLEFEPSLAIGDVIECARSEEAY